jgi:hypothetical protein
MLSVSVAIPELKNLPGCVTGIGRSPTLMFASSGEAALLPASINETSSSSAAGIGLRLVLALCAKMKRR